MKTPVSSRRSFIRGLPAGLAALTLIAPFWSRLIKRAMAQEATQRRLIVWYVPDGTVPEWMWPAQPGPLVIRSDRTNDLSGTDFNTALPEADRPTFILQPIARYADRILTVHGVSNPGDADHALSTQSALTGEAVKRGQRGTSPSLDVLMAEANLTGAHAEPVLRTGAYGEALSYEGTRDLSRPRNNNDRWVEPSWRPLNDARRVLDAVSSNTAQPDPSSTARTASRLATLGSVRDKIEALRCAAGTPAAHRLEAYVEEVSRLERLETEVRPSNGFEPGIVPNSAIIEAAQNDIARLPDVTPFIIETAASALALDYSPAVTIQWGSSGQNRISGSRLTDSRYDFLPELEYPGAGEHGLAHPEDGAFIAAGHRITAAISTRDRVRIRRWFFERMNDMLDRLASIPDGSGTLLDSTSVLYVSEFGGPNANSTRGQHSNQNLPYLLVAGKNTPFKAGQHLEVSRTHGDYLLTLAQGMGSAVTTMGVGTQRIDEMLR